MSQFLIHGENGVRFHIVIIKYCIIFCMYTVYMWYQFHYDISLVVKLKG